MKKLLVVVAAIAFGAVAQASELWWTVSDDAKVDNQDAEWTIAKLYANASGDTKNFGGTLVDSGIAADLADGGVVMSDISGYGSASSFYVELWNSDQLVGKSYILMNQPNPFDNQGAASMADIASSTRTSVMDTPPSSPYSFNNFTTSDVVPEPTSGLLVMLGMMMLGLKRKRV